MERYLTRQVEANLIDRDTAQNIMAYIYDRQVEKGITPGTSYNIALVLMGFIRGLGIPPARATTADTKRVYAKMRTDMKPNSFRQYLTITRAYLEHLKPPGLDLSVLKTIRNPTPEATKTAAGMLTEEEINSILDSITNMRDKAIVSLLYEGGFRPVEIRRLTWGEVKFDQWGAIINTSEKTGKPRYIRILSSTQYLATWKNEYPGTPKGTAPVFVTFNKPHRALSTSKDLYKINY